jgi:serine phosphatase RsbU (regulator of sigma subunit)
LSGKSKVLWVSQGSPPRNLRAALRGQMRLASWRPEKPLAGQLDASVVAVVGAHGSPELPRLMGSVLSELDRSGSVAVFLLPPLPQAQLAWKALSRRRGRFLCVSEDAGPEELRAKLAAAAELQPAIDDLRQELRWARAGAETPGAARKHAGPGRHTRAGERSGATRAHRRAEASAESELAQEMHLAARLQRDFLPRRLPEVGPVRFAVLYRPLGWVSGDIYDVTRLDETHLGFYVADAVGHGLPAALLTMFIKKAFQSKRILGDTYEIVPPEVSLSELNKDICQQAIASCPFCTAVYCVLDLGSMTMTYARAGHPEAVLLRAGGGVERLMAPGTLLGILPEATFESRQVRLNRGDRLVLYTDGAEVALCGPKPAPGAVEKALAKWGHLTREEFILRLSAHFDRHGGDDIQDDITVVVVDVMK